MEVAAERRCVGGSRRCTAAILAVGFRTGPDEHSALLGRDGIQCSAGGVDRTDTDDGLGINRPAVKSSQEDALHRGTVQGTCINQQISGDLEVDVAAVDLDPYGGGLVVEVDDRSALDIKHRRQPRAGRQAHQLLMVGSFTLERLAGVDRRFDGGVPFPRIGGFRGIEMDRGDRFAVGVHLVKSRLDRCPLRMRGARTVHPRGELRLRHKVFAGQALDADMVRQRGHLVQMIKFAGGKKGLGQTRISKPGLAHELERAFISGDALRDRGHRLFRDFAADQKRLDVR